MTTNPILDAAKGARTTPARSRVSSVAETPKRAENGLQTWQEYLDAHPKGGGYYNDWLLRSIEALMGRVAALERRLDEWEGGK